MRRKSPRASYRAGGNWGSRTAHGKHTRNPGWIAGQNWVECQRCGLDYRRKDIRREWTGAIVCKTCWEPRHPQDFVRARRDRIAAPGPSNTAASYSTTAAAGSSEIPAGTFAVGFTGSLGSLADQEHNSGDTISTISAAGQFPTAYDDGFESRTVTAWTLSGAPSGISIDSSGDITGTIGTLEHDNSPFLATVTAFYGEGQEISLDFNWLVNEAGIQPDAVTGNFKALWWDFSADEYNFSSAENDADKVVDEGVILETMNRFQPSSELTRGGLYSSRDVEWVANAQNSLGAANLVPDGGAITVIGNDSALNNVDSGAIYQPQEVFIVAQVPSDNIDLHTLFGPSNGTGHWCHINADENGQTMNIHTGWNDEIFPDFSDSTDLQPSMSAEVGNWYVWYLKYDNTSCAYQLNGVVPTGADTEITMHDANSDETKNTTQAGFRVGGASPSQGASTAPVNQWDGHIGEVVVYANTSSHNNEGGLTSAEVTGVITYLINKWGITTEVA